MDYAKSDCYGAGPPLALVVLVIAVMGAAALLRLWRQGIIVHVVFAFLAPSAYAERALLEMLGTGLLHLAILTGALAYAFRQSELTPTRIRLRVRAFPVMEPGYSAPSASSA